MKLAHGIYIGSNCHPALADGLKNSHFIRFSFSFRNPWLIYASFFNVVYRVNVKRFGEVSMAEIEIRWNSEHARVCIACVCVW